MRLRLRARNLALGCGLLVLLFGTTAAGASVAVNVSGYEIFLGQNCVLGGVPATCGTTFTGWTGETGSGGWRPFPGTGLGIWSLQINYTGQPSFNGGVNIVGGKWHFAFINGLVLQGNVLNGTVTWPDEGGSIGCGTNVAVGTANLTIASGGTVALQGCLHDLPKFSVIPPTIWGTYSFSF
jgi:hypothetical protein